MKLLRSRFEVVEPATIEEKARRDRDDLPILGTAVAARCDVLASGDKAEARLFQQHVGTKNE